MTKEQERAEELKKELEDAIRRYQTSQQILESTKRDLEIKKYQFRIAETYNVLDALNKRKDISNDIKTYLVHCMNCLNGNIDGIVLDANHVRGEQE